MVGFPGETEEEFLETAHFVEEIGFAEAHIFQYSPRQGTPAAARTDQIPPQIKDARSKIIAGITKKSQQEFLNAYCGQVTEVLFEQPCGDGFFSGKTGNYITVHVPTKADLSGQFRQVQLLEVKNDIILGELLPE